MQIRCTPSLLLKLTRLLSDQDLERVAAFIGRKVGDDYQVMDVVAAVNEDPDQANRFYVSNRQMGCLMDLAEAQGCYVIGIAHSHPAHHPAHPSPADIHNCRHQVNAVYHPTTRSLTWFNPSGPIGQVWVEPQRRAPIFQSVFAPA